MIIGVDGTPILGSRSGPGWYLTHLMEALSSVLEEDKAYLWMNNPREEENLRVPQNRYLVHTVSHYPAAALKMSWNTLGSPTLDTLVGRPLDVCLYAGLPVPPQKKGARVFFVHDLSCWTAPEWAMDPRSQHYGRELEKQIGAADLILTGSEYNRLEMKRLFPGLPEGKVRVVPHGVARMFQKAAPPEVLLEVKHRYNLTRPYALYVGSLETRKNLLRLVHGFLLFHQQVKTDMELILAGPKGWIGEEFMQFITSPALGGKVRWIDAVPPEHLWGLYTGAEMFAYPALTEGFGLPMLEAMGCGTPVMYAANGALPEVAGDAGMQVAATDVNQWASAFVRLHQDQDLRSELIHRGAARVTLYRWEKTAQQTLESLRQAVKARG